MRKYEEQYERVKRWYQRFKIITYGTHHDKNTDFLQDDVYAFFINCYHLKDWIKNDETVDKTAKSKIRKFLEKDDMKLCAKICNGNKHLLKDGNIPDITHKKVELELGVGVPKIYVKYYISTSKGDINVFILATNCMEKWEEFIKKEIK